MNEEAFRYSQLHDAFAGDCVIGPGQNGVTAARARTQETRLLHRHVDRGRRSQAGPMGPGGKFTGTNRVQGMECGCFRVTHAEFKGAMGKGMETAYMGYDSNDKVYTYDSFNTLGEADHAKGNVNGNTWIWD